MAAESNARSLDDGDFVIDRMDLAGLEEFFLEHEELFTRGLSIKQAVFYYGETRKSLKAKVEDGSIPAIRLPEEQGGKWRVFPDGVPEQLQNLIPKKVRRKQEQPESEPVQSETAIQTENHIAELHVIGPAKPKSRNKAKSKAHEPKAHEHESKALESKKEDYSAELNDWQWNETLENPFVESSTVFVAEIPIEPKMPDFPVLNFGTGDLEHNKIVELPKVEDNKSLSSPVLEPGQIDVLQETTAVTSMPEPLIDEVADQIADASAPSVSELSVDAEIEMEHAQIADTAPLLFDPILIDATASDYSIETSPEIPSLTQDEEETAAAIIEVPTSELAVQTETVSYLADLFSSEEISEPTHSVEAATYNYEETCYEQGAELPITPETNTVVHEEIPLPPAIDLENSARITNDFVAMAALEIPCTDFFPSTSGILPELSLTDERVLGAENFVTAIAYESSKTDMSITEGKSFMAFSKMPVPSVDTTTGGMIEIDSLLDRLSDLEKQLDAVSDRNNYLETRVLGLEDQIKFLTHSHYQNKGFNKLILLLPGLAMLAIIYLIRFAPMGTP